MSGQDVVVVRYSPGERRAVLVFSLLGTALDGADFAIFILFLAPLAAYFHLSILAVDAVQAGSYVAGIAGAWLFGVLAGRAGRRWGLAATMALYSLASLAAAFSPDYTVLFALRLIGGVGLGGELGIALSSLNEAWPSQRRGVLSALLQGMFLVGSALATVLFAVCSARFGPAGWRWGLGLLGSGALVAAVVRRWMPESRVWTASRGGSEQRAVLGSILRQPRWRGLTVRLLGLLTAISFTAYAVETFLPTAWITVYRLPLGTVDTLVFLGLAVIFVAYLLFGRLSDARGRRTAAFDAAVFGAVGFAAFALLLGVGWDRGSLPGRLPLGTTAVFLWMLAAAAPYAVQGAWLSELFPTDIRAAAVNFVYYVGRAVGGGLAPLGALALAQALGGDVRLAMELGLLGTVAVALLVRGLPETRGQPLPLRSEDLRPVVVEG